MMATSGNVTKYTYYTNMNNVYMIYCHIIPYQKICTKITQNTKFVYILYTKIVQIKILYDNECTKNVHHISTYIQKMYKLYKTCTKFRPKTAWNLKCIFLVHTNNVQTMQNLYIQLANWNGFCMLFVHTNNVQTIENLYNRLTEMAFICFLYIQRKYKLYKMDTNVNRIIHAADKCFLYTKSLHSLLFEFLHQ